jgi:predicted small metal-binding protein
MMSILCKEIGGECDTEISGEDYFDLIKRAVAHSESVHRETTKRRREHASDWIAEILEAIKKKHPPIGVGKPVVFTCRLSGDACDFSTRADDYGGLLVNMLKHVENTHPNRNAVLKMFRFSKILEKGRQDFDKANTGPGNG